MADYTNALATITQAELASCGVTPGHTPYDAAVLLIDEDGSVSLVVRTYHGGDSTPESEWNGRDMAKTLGANPDLDTLREQLADGGELAMLIDRVIAGHDTKWNGNNYVGTLTEDAREASEELTEKLEEFPQSSFTFWGAEEWLLGQQTKESMLAELKLTASSTEAEIAAAAAEMHAQADNDMVVLVGKDVEQILTRLVEEVREAEAEDA